MPAGRPILQIKAKTQRHEDCRHQRAFGSGDLWTVAALSWPFADASSAEDGIQGCLSGPSRFGFPKLTRKTRPASAIRRDAAVGCHHGLGPYRRDGHGGCHFRRERQRLAEQWRRIYRRWSTQGDS
jgi:hypothetical protein